MIDFIRRKRQKALLEQTSIDTVSAGIESSFLGFRASLLSIVIVLEYLILRFIRYYSQYFSKNLQKNKIQNV